MGRPHRRTFLKLVRKDLVGSPTGSQNEKPNLYKFFIFKELCGFDSL